MCRVDPSDIRHLVVLGHPAPLSFNRLVAHSYMQTVQDCGQTASLRDLYARHFNPCLGQAERPGGTTAELAPDVKAELGPLHRSAVLVLVYPLWFGGPPAIIKGYVDRILGAGFPLSALKPSGVELRCTGKRLVMLTSSASGRPWLEERGHWLALRRAFDEYLATIFGFDAVEHLHFDAIVPDLTKHRIMENLAALRECARHVCADVFAERHRAHTALIMAKREVA